MATRKHDEPKSKPQATIEHWPEPDTNPGKKKVTVPIPVEDYGRRCTCPIATINAFFPPSAHAPGCPVRG